VTITREERDALYEMVIDRLSGIGDVWLSVVSRLRDLAASEALGEILARLAQPAAGALEVTS